MRLVRVYCGRCLRPDDGVAQQRSVFLIVVGAKHGRRARTVALATSGSKQAPMVALSVSMLSRSNTPFFDDVSSVLAVFVKNKQNARDIRKKRGKNGGKKLTVLKTLKKTIVKLQKRRKTGKLR